MTEKQFKRKKLSAVCSLEAYNKLQELINESSGNFPYPPTVDQYFYSKTNHREYLSKFLESVIIKHLRHLGYDNTVKVKTTGQAIFNRGIGGAQDGKILGVMGYAKDSSKIKGEPDIRSVMHGRQVYFEVKVGSDKLSPDQKEFIKRGERLGYIVAVVKTVDDYLEKVNVLINTLKNQPLPKINL